MTGTPTLKRLSAAPHLPFPRAVRVGDFIYTSSIYPVDAAGRVVEGEPWLGVAAPSAVAVQTRHCLITLKDILAELQSALALVIKVDIHLAFACDFYEFKSVWREFFPTDPPARTTIEVGDTFPFSGVRISLDAVAIVADGKLGRQTLVDPKGPSSLEAEWASDAVRAGNFVFCSGFPASDFQNGLAVGKPPGFPYYGSDAEMQAEHVFDRLDRVLGQAGTSVEQIVESQLYEPDLRTFYDVDRVWGKRMPTPPTRSSMGVKGLIVPGAAFVPNFVALVPDAEHQKKESRKGIAWHPQQRKVNFSPTITVGPWRFFAGQIASDDYRTVPKAPEGLPHHFSSIEMQTRFTLDLLTKQLEANETDWEHCFHVRVFLIEPLRDYRGFLRAWQSYFPDSAKAPAVAYVPCTTMMFNGPLIEIDPTCVVKS
jgi:enamine deaminase RidA (YjgF/YER057c/UK114 family)